MSTLEDLKQIARKAAFERRKVAKSIDTGTSSALLSSVLAGYRGVPTAGYFPIRTEIDPTPAMAEAAAHGIVGVPVITAAAQPLLFSKWTPDCAMKEGPFGANIPAVDDYFDPEVLIVPLVAFDRHGNRLGYGGGFYDRTLERLRGRRATLAIGFAYGMQEAEDLPLEPTDQPLDMIVTEAEIIEMSRA